MIRSLLKVKIGVQKGVKEERWGYEICYLSGLVPTEAKGPRICSVIFLSKSVDLVYFLHFQN